MRKSPPGFIRGYGPEHALGMTELNRCPWCNLKKGRTHIAFYSLHEFVNNKGYRLRSPSASKPTIAVSTHFKCANINRGKGSVGYLLEIGELVNHPNDWYRELQNKPWESQGLSWDNLIYDVLILFENVAGNQRKGKAYKSFNPQEVRRKMKSETEMTKELEQAETVIEFFKNGEELAIRTSATTEDRFLTACARALESMIDEELFKGDWEFQLRQWLQSIVEISNRIKGYKSPEVREQRLLMAGSLSVNGKKVCSINSRGVESTAEAIDEDEDQKTG